MANEKLLKKQAFSVRLLQVLCVLVAIGWLILTIVEWDTDSYIMGTRISPSHLMLGFTILWIIITVGILLLKVWSWAFLLGLSLFTVMVTTNLWLTMLSFKLNPSVYFGFTVGLIFLHSGAVCACIRFPFHIRRWS